MSKYNLFFLIGLVGGFLIGAAPASVQANIVKVGPQPIIPTDIAKGTLFVKPNGSGEICSVANPCDIRTAIAKASGGDVVFLRGGTYTFSKTLNFWSKASAENPIIFESYPGETAVFDGSQHAKGTKIFLRVAGKFIQLRGLEVKNMPSHGIFIEGTDNLIEGVRVHGSGLDGIKVFSPYEAFPYGEYGSRNIIRNCTVHNNSDVGFFTDGLNNGWNADGISIASGTDNRVENCLVYHNSDDGIDSWRSVNTYIGYNIVHSNGIADGDGNGIKAGGQRTDSGTVVEYNLSYSNKAVGITHNTGVNLTFSNNTTWNNKASYTIGSDTVATNNIGTEASKFGSGIEIDNSWQRSGSVAFVSTDSRSANFLVPENDGGFEDIGALANATSTNTTDDTTISLPDVVVTQVSYANGIFTSTVKNQGNAATPEGVAVAVGYSVDGKYKTWGGVNGPLAAGASVTISTNGAPYVIPSGTHTITAYVDDVDRFEESNENNNQLSQSITVPGSGDAKTTAASLPDVVVTQISYANGIFTSTVKNQGNAATPEGVAVAVGYSVDGKYKTWGGVNGPLAAGASVTISTNGAPYVIPSGTHTITAYVDDVDRFEESNESNNRISQSIAVR